MKFQKMDAAELSENAIGMIRDKWPLLVAGKPDDFNFMTVNWGMIGELWFKDAVTVYVRESRYTLKFMQDNHYFSLVVLKKGFEKALSIAGSKSGRDIDKVAETQLTPIEIDGIMAFEEAETIFVLKRMFVQDLPIDLIEDPDIVSKAYANGDPHKMFIGEILSVYSAIE